MKHAILCVDDEKDNVDALERLFRRDYKVFKALSGDEGLEILAENPHIALIVSDQRMPGMTGVEMLKESLNTHPHAIRLLLTGYTDMESVVDAVNAGEIYRYLTKPWDPVDLKNTIDKAIEKFELRSELQQKNIDLQEALDELKTLDQAKSNFMILINHELKTPLTTMISFLGLLNETSLDEEQKKYLLRILQSTDRLTKLVNDALILVQAETGQLKVALKAVDMEKIMSELITQYASQLEAKELVLVPDFEINKVIADGKHIKDVLSRLIENAIQFTEPGQQIHFQMVPEEGEVHSEWARLSLANPGKTMARSTIMKILKPFALDENVMNHHKGTGMGLSICQALLKQMSSELQIESKKDHFEISFSLPLG